MKYKHEKKKTGKQGRLEGRDREEGGRSRRPKTVKEEREGIQGGAEQNRTDKGKRERGKNTGTHQERKKEEGKREERGQARGQREGGKGQGGRKGSKDSRESQRTHTHTPTAQLSCGHVRFLGDSFNLGGRAGH